MGLVFSIYSFASVAASPVLGRCVQLGYIRRVTLLLAGLLVVSHLFSIHGTFYIHFRYHVRSARSTQAACRCMRMRGAPL